MGKPGCGLKACSGLNICAHWVAARRGVRMEPGFTALAAVPGRPVCAGHGEAASACAGRLPAEGGVTAASLRSYIMEKADLVIVGAEGVVENGGIINKVGAPLCRCSRAGTCPTQVTEACCAVRFSHVILPSPSACFPVPEAIVVVGPVLVKFPCFGD